MTKIRTSIVLDEDMYKLLKLINRNTGIPVSRIVENALTVYFKDKLELVKKRKWSSLIDKIMG